MTSKTENVGGKSGRKSFVCNLRQVVTSLEHAAGTTFSVSLVGIATRKPTVDTKKVKRKEPNRKDSERGRNKKTAK